MLNTSDVIETENEKKRLIILFLKTFFISLVTLSVVVTIAFVVWLRYSFVQAPVVMDPSFSISDVLGPDQALTQDDINLIESGQAPNVLAHLSTFERKPDFFTILVVGLDGTVNANVIMVVAYDVANGEINLLSIPRDTRVDANRNRRKIVSAYPVGMLNGRGHDGGIDNMKREVATLIGFRPDFYVLVDFDAFVRVVDAVGGVEIDVPFHMRYDDPLQNLRIDIQPGPQVLDGENALHFVRFRRSNDPRFAISDYQRIENQQLVINTLARELLSVRTVLQIPELVRTYRSYVRTDLSIGEKIWLAEQALSIDNINALSTYTLPISGTSGAPQWYEFADRDATLELVNRTINPFTQDITRDMVRIVN